MSEPTNWGRREMLTKEHVNPGGNKIVMSNTPESNPPCPTCGCDGTIEGRAVADFRARVVKLCEEKVAEQQFATAPYSRGKVEAARQLAKEIEEL